jgi:signal transduction histidine kinase
MTGGFGSLPRRIRGWDGWRSPGVVHATLAVSCLVIGILAVEAAAWLGWHPRGIWDYRLVVLLTSLVVIGGRRLPITTLVGAAVAVSWPWWHFDVPEPRVVPLVVAAYLAATWSSYFRLVLPVGLVGGVLGSFSGVVENLSRPGGVELDDLITESDPSQHLMSVAFVIVAALFGLATRRLRHTATELRRRNDQLVQLRNADRERAIADERVAISREIHDVVAHHVTAIVVQAQAGQRMPGTRTSEAEATLRNIVTAGSDALTAMRRAVGALREPHIEPVALPDALRASAATASNAGLEVSIEVPAGLRLHDYAVATLTRVTQESLTNVLLHSTAAAATVRLEHAGAVLILTIRDDGSPIERPLPNHSGGYGIPGMQERATFLGGTLVAGPDTAAGWKVTLTVPAQAMIAS